MKLEDIVWLEKDWRLNLHMRFTAANGSRDTIDLVFPKELVADNFCNYGHMAKAEAVVKQIYLDHKTVFEKMVADCLRTKEAQEDLKNRRIHKFTVSESDFQCKDYRSDYGTL
jgi:hypothetical protein